MTITSETAIGLKLGTYGPGNYLVKIGTDFAQFVLLLKDATSCIFFKIYMQLNEIIVAVFAYVSIILCLLLLKV